MIMSMSHFRQKNHFLLSVALSLRVPVKVINKKVGQYPDMVFKVLALWKGFLSTIPHHQWAGWQIDQRWQSKHPHPSWFEKSS